MEYSIENEKRDVVELCNEDLYLYCDNPELMEKINFYKHYYYNGFITNKKIFKSAFINYDKFVKLSSKLVSEIGMKNNSISYFITTSKLLHEGSFSKDLELVKDKDGLHIINLIGLPWLNIINGYACCRHFSPFFNDIFSNLNLVGDPIAIVGDKGMTLSEAFTTLVDHDMNIIKYKDLYYGVDSYNLDFLKFKNGFTMNSYIHNDYFFYIKPAITVISFNENYSKFLKKITLINESSKKESIEYKEFKEILSETLNLIKENLDLIKDFERDTMELKKNIISSTSMLW